MDATDDDFGDLYVDAEAQATSAVAGNADLGKFPGESECGTDLDRIESSETMTTPWPDADAGTEAKKLSVATRESSLCVDGGGDVTQIEEIIDSEDSESDDDLNIVLTDGDDENGGYNDVGPNGVEASDSNNSARRPETGNGCLMSDNPKTGEGMKTEASGNNACINRAEGTSQCGYSFFQPWCRTVFGSSIKLFEEKPWRNPGANITDFFNFGFNEESWEDYCKSLRHHYAFTNQVQHAMALDYDFQDKTQVEPSARSSDGRSSLLMKGRAIEVEDRTLERIPSVDLRRPRDPDPDVVIQITVDSSVRELSGSTIEEPGHLPTESAGASGNENDNKQMHSSVDSTEEHASMEFQEGNNIISSSEQSPLEENCCSPEGAPCAKEVIDKEEKDVCGNSDDSDPYQVERESSLPDQIHFSPTPSYSVGRSQESEDSETGSDQLEGSTPPRPTKPSEYKVHERNNIKTGERNETKHPSRRKSHVVGKRNGRKRVRPRRSHEELRKRHCGRPDYVVQREIQLENVRDSSSGSESDSDSGKEKLVRYRRPFCYSRKYRNIAQPSNSSRGDRDDKGFHLSDRERRYSRIYSSTDRGRREKGELHKFDYQSNKQSLHRRGMEHSYGYNYEKEFGDYTAHSSFNYPRRKSSWSFKEEEDPYNQRHCERGYIHERSAAFLNDWNIRGRNQYDSRTEHFYMEKVHSTERDHRFFSDNRRYNHQWGQENDLRYRDRYDYDSLLHRYPYEDEVHREKYGVPLKSAYHERQHSFDEPDRRGYPEYERDGEFSCRGETYNFTPDWRIDGFASEKAGFHYRMKGVEPSYSLSLRESRYAKGARSEIWKADRSFDSRREQSYKAGQSNDDRVGKLTGIGLNNDEDWRYKSKKKYQTRDVTHHDRHPLNTDDMSEHYRSRTPAPTEERSSHSHGKDRIQDPDDVINGRQGKAKLEGAHLKNLHGYSRFKIREESRKLGKKKHLQIQDSEGGIEEIDEERIKESLKKMEKRRERFKESETEKKRVARGEDEAKAHELRADTDEIKKQQRPARKRRWCAS